LGAILYNRLYNSFVAYCDAQAVWNDVFNIVRKMTLAVMLRRLPSILKPLA